MRNQALVRHRYCWKQGSCWITVFQRGVACNGRGLSQDNESLCPSYSCWDALLQDYCIAPITTFWCNYFCFPLEVVLLVGNKDVGVCLLGVFVIFQIFAWILFKEGMPWLQFQMCFDILGFIPQNQEIQISPHSWMLGYVGSTVLSITVILKDWLCNQESGVFLQLIS